MQLIGTAHGNTLDNLMSNPTLSDLIGGIQAVTLGDEEARRRGTQKTVLERKAPPTFDVLVEIQSWDRVSVYSDVASAVDSILRGEEPLAELRSRDVDGQVTIEAGSLLPRNDGSEGGTYVGRRHGDGGRGDGGARRLAAQFRQRPGRAHQQWAQPHPRSDCAEHAPAAQPQQRIYPFGVSRDRLERSIANLHVPATIVRDMSEATMVMTLKSYYRQGSQRVRQAEDRGVPVYVLRNNTITQMERQLSDVFQISSSENDDQYVPPRAAQRRERRWRGACDRCHAGGRDGDHAGDERRAQRRRAGAARQLCAPLATSDG